MGSTPHRRPFGTSWPTPGTSPSGTATSTRSRECRRQDSNAGPSTRPGSDSWEPGPTPRPESWRSNPNVTPRSSSAAWSMGSWRRGWNPSIGGGRGFVTAWRSDSREAPSGNWPREPFRCWERRPCAGGVSGRRSARRRTRVADGLVPGRLRRPGDVREDLDEVPGPVRHALAEVEVMGPGPPVRRFQREREGSQVSGHVFGLGQQGCPNPSAPSVLGHDEVGDPGMWLDEVRTSDQGHVDHPNHDLVILGHEDEPLRVAQPLVEAISYRGLVWRAQRSGPAELFEQGSHSFEVLGARFPDGGGHRGSRSRLRLALLFPPAVQPDLLAGPPDQVAEETPEHRAREHHPDQAGVAGNEDEVHFDWLRVRDDEDDQDDHDGQGHQHLGHPSLAGPLELVEMFLVGLAISVGLAGSRDPLPSFCWNVGFAVHRPSSEEIDPSRAAGSGQLVAAGPARSSL